MCRDVRCSEGVVKCYGKIHRSGQLDAYQDIHSTVGLGRLGRLGIRMGAASPLTYIGEMVMSPDFSL